MNDDLNSLQIIKTRLAKGWQRYQCEIAPIHLEVLAIPAHTMTEYQWGRISRARASYASMWSPKLGKVVQEDPFDGRDSASPYRVTHYIATATTPEGLEKVVTMRKVTLPPGFDASKHTLPDDLNFWKVVNNLTGEEQSLWAVVQGNLGAAKNQASLAAVSRTGTYLGGMDNELAFTPAQKVLVRDMSILSFALIQLAATEQDDGVFWFFQLCAEFQEKVFALQTNRGRFMLDFAKTGATLNLPDQYQLKLDNNSPTVQFLKLNFPGYWLDNQKAARLLSKLVRQERLSREVLAPYLALVQKGNYPVTPALTDYLLSELTSPRYFKYLIPLLNSDKPITSRLSGEELRQLMLDEAGDGPFSSTIKPLLWRKSAVELLQQARRKYAFQPLAVAAS